MLESPGPSRFRVVGSEVAALPHGDGSTTAAAAAACRAAACTGAAAGELSPAARRRRRRRRPPRSGGGSASAGTATELPSTSGSVSEPASDSPVESGVAPAPVRGAAPGEPAAPQAGMNREFGRRAAPSAAAAPPGERRAPPVEPPGRPRGLGPGAGGGAGSGDGAANAKIHEVLKGALTTSQKDADSATILPLFAQDADGSSKAKEEGEDVGSPPPPGSQPGGVTPTTRSPPPPHLALRAIDGRKAGSYGGDPLSDAVVEYAKTHVELKCAFMTYQSDADQIYPGWREKLAELVDRGLSQ